MAVEIKIGFFKAVVWLLVTNPSDGLFDLALSCITAQTYYHHREDFLRTVSWVTEVTSNATADEAVGAETETERLV